MASQNIRKSNSYKEEGRKLIHQFSQKLMSEQCNANEVDKKLSKHWLKMDNLALHNQLFTSMEILEMITSSGDQHLDPAEGVSSHFPRQSVRVITPRTSASTHSKAQFWKCQDDNASMYKLSITRHMHYDSFSKIWI